MLVAHAALLFLPLVALVPLTVLAANAGKGETDRTINVSGEAEVRVAPDQVQLWFRVETSDKNLATAKKSNDERVKRALALFQQFGVQPKHLQTDYLSVTPNWDDYGRSRDKPPTYAVSKSVVVTLTDVKRFEELVSTALDGGVNVIDGIQFSTTELRKHRDRARALALKAAQEKATAMAAELGMKVGKPRSINESSSWSGYGWRGPGGRSMAQNAVQNMAGGGEPLASDEGFAPGQISVSASVQVTFDLTE
jgi:uncharacterized protein